MIVHVNSEFTGKNYWGIGFSVTESPHLPEMSRFLTDLKKSRQKLQLSFKILVQQTLGILATFLQ